jgi:hypothetical protein
LALCLSCTHATAEQRYGEWVLDQPRSLVLTLSFKQSVSRDDRVARSELGFVCDDDNKFVGAVLIPFDGTFQNHQAVIPLVIQRDSDQYDPSDLLQHWQNAIEYIFLQSKDEMRALVSYLKARETEGLPSVHFYFPNDLDADPQTTNHIAVSVSGFSDGFNAFQKSCIAAR